MIQPLKTTRSLILTVATGGTAAPMATQPTPARQLMVKARSTNTGTVKILGIQAGPGGTIDADGFSLAAGAALPEWMWIQDLQQVAFVSSQTNDVVEIIYTV